MHSLSHIYGLLTLCNKRTNTGEVFEIRQVESLPYSGYQRLKLRAPLGKIEGCLFLANINPSGDCICHQSLLDGGGVRGVVGQSHESHVFLHTFMT